MILLSFMEITLRCVPPWVFPDLRMRILRTRRLFDVFDGTHIPSGRATLFLDSVTSFLDVASCPLIPTRSMA